jgi:hypothetical protein
MVTVVSNRRGFFDYAAPLLSLAEDYFLQPHDELPQDGGWEALLGESFLALRLLEKVNDYPIRLLRRPLLPLDMTEANIIVRYLLGDSFDARMEQLVQLTASHLLHIEHMWDQVRDRPATVETAVPRFSSEKLTISADKIRLRLTS